MSAAALRLRLSGGRAARHTEAQAAPATAASAAARAGHSGPGGGTVTGNLKFKVPWPRHDPPGGPRPASSWTRNS